jgi:uncharacterized membrane protein YkvA (DUF1232 family)
LANLTTKKAKMTVDCDSSDLTKLSGRFLPGSASKEVQAEPGFVMTWRKRAQRLQKEAYVFYFVFKHPRTSWYARLVAVCTAAYLSSPVQIIPNYIPVLGILDDLLLVFLGVKLLQRITPADILAECRGLADAAEVRRKEKIKSAAAVVASVAVATVWLLAAFIASALMAEYIRH